MSMCFGRPSAWLRCVRFCMVLTNKAALTHFDMHILLSFFFTQWTCTLYMRSVLWFSSSRAKILWPRQQRTGPHARNGLSLAWLMAATACPLSAATWLWKTKCKHWWICFKWSKCKLLTGTCWLDAEKNKKNKIQTKRHKTVSRVASPPCRFCYGAHHCTCTAVPAACLISRWCLGSKTRHARDSRALLQPAVQMGPPCINHILLLWLSTHRGLGPFPELSNWKHETDKVGF